MPHPLSTVVRSAVCCFLFLAAFGRPLWAADGATAPPPAESAPREENAPASPPEQPQSAEQDQTFEITAFKLEGTTLFPVQRLLDLLDDLVGTGRTAADVEKARDILEKHYHEEGYPTVLVNIPEQSVENGVIRLQVIESKVSVTRVTGNRHFSTELILDKLPSIAPGAILYAPNVQKEINKVNRNPDLKVIPSMAPGKELGTVDVELKAEDRLPFHGSLEFNNRNSHDTTPLRLNLSAHYDNLWGKEHSFSLQYQASPQKLKEVEVVSGSYMLPAPWDKDTSLIVYSVYSNSNTTFGDAFNTIGKGDIVGGRYVIPFPPYEAYNHSAVLGFDYKHFRENTGQTGVPEGTTSSPVEYLPLSLAYSGSLPDSTGITLFNAAFNMAFRGMVVRQQNFEEKRFKARGNYFYTTLGVERRQKLPGGAALGVKLDGQIADQPLISNEQYAAGGMDSVRGYKESELMGDNTFHGILELSAPDLAPLFGLRERFLLTPYTFYDFAALFVKDPLPGQEDAMNLQGTGVGIRGYLFRDVEFQLDWAFALSDTAKTKTGDNQLYFKVKYQF
ncbi:MAG: polypeptide-transport-associated domain-containing [Geobacteraceae bacterium]|nr:MAG: polypeptide-transport-associated domain-containing [Geobacteraceae bacterium]